MRGKVFRVIRLYDICRITPAYAGKRRLSVGFGACLQDHPCVCGEKTYIYTSRSLARGSPLRMRGKVQSVFTVQMTNRITPAYAGKRATSGQTLLASTDHPCVCGEKQDASSYSLVVSGSPLRMRGKALFLRRTTKL